MGRTGNAFLPETYMLVPTLACQARCRYCFAPHASAVMDDATLFRAVETVKRLSAGRSPVQVLFHGGEPLLAGVAFYEKALPLLQEALGRRVRFSLQSNLWALNDAYIELFARYRVRVGTSLDGPERLNDAQRGAGYFLRTMNGVDKLRRAGLPVSAIATVTSATLPHLVEILQFFFDEQIPYTLRPAAMCLGQTDAGDALDDAGMEEFYRKGLELLSARPLLGRPRDLEAPVAAAFGEKSKLCTFSDCLGKYLAIAPDGELYACQRFCGAKEYRLGNVSDAPSESSILASEGYGRLAALTETRKAACGDCRHYGHCHGGCLYARAAAESAGKPMPGCDECAAPPRMYRRLFDELDIALAREMCGVLAEGKSPAPYLAMAGNLRHPADALAAKRLFLQGVQWADEGLPPYAFSMRDHRREVYLNVTERCPLRCRHCSVSAGAGGLDMPLKTVVRLAEEAAALGYGTVSLNGGEPMAHREFPALVEALGGCALGETRLVLNTNLYLDASGALLTRMRETFDRIVVSLDGGRAAHDERRGVGAFDRTVANVKRLLGCEGKARVYFRAALTAGQRQNGVAQEVREIARALGVCDVTVTGVLPVGRAHGIPDACTVHAFPEGERFFEKRFRLRDGCGVGECLHVAPDGVIYPCWARMTEADALGTADTGLYQAALQCENRIPVDCEPRCQTCRFRYICGGVCRAFSDADCEEKYRSLETLLQLAQEGCADALR